MFFFFTLDVNKVTAQIKSPTILKVGKEVIIAAHGKPLLSMPLGKYSMSEVVLAYMGVFYVFNLSYPPYALATLLFIQSEILQDEPHDDDKHHLGEGFNKYKEFAHGK